MACAHCSGHGAGTKSTGSKPAYYIAGQAHGAAPHEACSCACGELEAHCRPRWVAGMVITEADLNRLDRYVTGKQRLHNRFVHGTGVAGGLAVTCHPCGDGMVRVQPGYAIGPCGEDIVVPREDSVDVCALIRHCRSQERRGQDCRPWGEEPACRDLTEQWVLAIRYDEAPSRNAPMLRAGARDRDCGCGGSPGSSKGGSCGCGGHGGASGPAKASRRESPVACAPTVVCETYRYEVFRAPAHPDCNPRGEGKRDPSRFVERFNACVGDLLESANQPPSASLSPDLDAAGRRAWTAFCMKLKGALHAHLSGGGGTSCAAIETLCAQPCPGGDLTGQAFFDAMQASMSALYGVLFQALKDCICLTALPPLPEPAEDPRVPLALLTVEGGAACRVVNVCNWTPLRPVLGTFPNLAYWMDAAGLLTELRRVLFCLCCGGVVPQTSRGNPTFSAPAGLFAGPLASAAGSFDLNGLGVVGDWIAARHADPGQVLRAVGLAGGVGAGVEGRLEALEAEIAALKAKL